jgi:hypothetical protein
MFLFLIYSVLSVNEVQMKNKLSHLDYYVEDKKDFESKFIILTLESLEDLDDKKLELND